ncbi:hypothetical protein OIO90_004135 [Microbotryomycetes sp. JL221]|nr:hypothetical protein OIO90_004135 [Microbotryomycetes sp. JL221]
MREKHGHPAMPRIILVRHGQTEWSLNGRHTGTSDIPLTEDGEQSLRELAPKVVGNDKPLSANKIQHAFVSPRKRAQRTFELLFEGQKAPPHSTEEDVREWDYGQYEGKTSAQIKAERGTSWDIWTEGCPGGESAQAISHKEGDCEGDGDVLIVSHGHFSRCFLTRWCRLPLTDGRVFVVDTGAISICGYQHGNLQERSLLGINLYGQV